LGVYIDGIDRTQHSLDVTSFLHSEFWHSQPFSQEIVAANNNLSKRVKKTNGYARRIFITNEPVHSYITMSVQRAYRHHAEEDDRSLLQQLDQGIHNLEQFSQDFAMRIIESNVLPPLPLSGFDPNKYELAIYDDWRIDRFEVDLKGNIKSVEVYPKTLVHFDVLLSHLGKFFKDAWTIPN